MLFRSALSQVFPRAGGPPLGPRPQQEEPGRPDVSPSCWVASLNLSFLHCKKGAKVPNLVGMCDFSRLTWEPDPACSRSSSEDRGPGMCWGRADRAVFPSDSLGVAWAPALWPHPLLTVSHACPSPMPETFRIGSSPIPTAWVRKLGLRGLCGLLKVTPPGSQFQKWNQTP